MPEYIIAQLSGKNFSIVGYLNMASCFHTVILTELLPETCDIIDLKMLRSA